MRFLLVVVGVALAGRAVPAEEEPRVARVTGEAVRFRAGPGTRHHILASLGGEDLVLVVGREGPWVKARLPGGFPCYVHGGLVAREEDGTAVVSASRVLLRVTAGKERLPLETVLEKGESLYVLGEEGEWLRVVSPPRAHGYVYEEFVELLGPASEYRQALAAAGAKRLGALRGSEGEEAAPARDPERQEELRREALRVGEAVLAGEGDREDLAARLRAVAVESDDDLTRGYAGALLALLAQREEAEELRLRLERTSGEKEEEIASLRAQVADAEARYREGLQKAQALRRMRESPFRAMGAVEAREGEHVLVADGRVLFRLRSKRFRLEDYVGRRVGVNGRMVMDDPETGQRHLMVERLEILEGERPGR